MLEAWAELSKDSVFASDRYGSGIGTVIISHDSLLIPSYPSCAVLLNLLAVGVGTLSIDTGYKPDVGIYRAG